MSRKVTDPHEQDVERALEHGLAESEVKGRPLTQRHYAGPPSLESYLRAAGGPLPYMIRLRTIEQETAKHERQLAEARAGLERAYAGQPQRLERAWEIVLDHWDFSAVNRLIAAHNRWYPVEARLPMDPVTKDYALVRGKPYLRRPLGRWLADEIALRAA